ncbi:MAG: hypothetical protein LBQ44_00890, partial [Treponema sp.]|nr:hypothetical protein [Treponema sp.]
MDPEIAALLGTDTSSAPAPDYSNLFEEPPVLDGEQPEKPEEAELKLGAEAFPEITKRFEEVPLKIFSDPNYYKAALSGEGPGAQRVHTILQKYV